MLLRARAFVRLTVPEEVLPASPSSTSNEGSCNGDEEMEPIMEEPEQEEEEEEDNVDHDDAVDNRSDSSGTSTEDIADVDGGGRWVWS